MSQSFIIIFAVADIPRAREFYDKVFGWSKSVNLEMYVEYDCREGLKFSLYKRESFALNVGRLPFATPNGELSSTELYVRVDDLDDVIQKLKDTGAMELSARAPRPWGDEAAYYSDPDGNVIAVARRIDSL